MAAEPGAKKPKSALTIALIVAGVISGGVCVIGILAAIAIPAFIGYVQRSKASEARSNVLAIHAGVSSYAGAERVGGSGLPPSLPRTPSTVPCGDKEMWPIDADPAWADLGFSPADPLYYSYSVEVDPNGRDFTVVAEGDLDCDGALSRFELRGRYDPATGDVTREGEILAIDELE